jgi:hypothetical protein
VCVFRVPRSSDLRVWDRGGKPLYGSTCYVFPPCWVSCVMGPSCLVLSCLFLSCLVLSCLVLSRLVLSCLVLSRGRLRDRDRRRGSSTAYCVSSRHTPHSAPLSSLSRLAPPLFAVAIFLCARRVSLVLGPRAFALGLWCLRPRFVPSFRFYL